LSIIESFPFIYCVVQNTVLIQSKYWIQDKDISLLQYRLTKSSHDHNKIILYEVKVRYSFVLE